MSTPMLGMASVLAFWAWRRHQSRSKVGEFLKRLGLMHTEESIEHGLSFEPRPTDAFIVSYPKCGTTWMQSIAHFLRSRGRSRAMLDA